MARSFKPSLFDLVLLAGLVLLFLTHAAPGLGRMRMKAQAHQMKMELGMIQTASKRAALDAGIARGETIAFSLLAQFLDGEDLPRRFLKGLDPFGNAYPAPTAADPPEVAWQSASRLRGLVAPTFWDPFTVREVSPPGHGEGKAQKELR